MKTFVCALIHYHNVGYAIDIGSGVVRVKIGPFERAKGCTSATVCTWSIQASDYVVMMELVAALFGYRGDG